MEGQINSNEPPNSNWLIITNTSKQGKNQAKNCLK